MEGLIHTDGLEPEGSFGESHGYSDPRTFSPYFEVTGITHRREPIWVSIISQLTPSESSKTKQRAHETYALKLLREHHGFKGVQRVALYEPLLNRQYGVIKMKKVSDIEPWDAMYALLGTRTRSKIIVAVDDDIDAEDPMAVNWAIVNRSQPHRDMRIIQPRPLPHGPLRFLADGNSYDKTDSALLIDATAKGPFPPISLPAREYMERAKELGTSWIYPLWNSRILGSAIRWACGQPKPRRRRDWRQRADILRPARNWRLGVSRRLPEAASMSSDANTAVTATSPKRR